MNWADKRWVRMTAVFSGFLGGFAGAVFFMLIMDFPARVLDGPRIGIFDMVYADTFVVMDREDRICANLGGIEGAGYLWLNDEQGNPVVDISAVVSPSLALVHADGKARAELYLLPGGSASLEFTGEGASSSGLELSLYKGKETSLVLYDNQHIQPAASLMVEPGSRRLVLYDGEGYWGSVFELCEEDEGLELVKWDGSTVWQAP